jgi:glucosyl-dolichyl phosphate glucuronosyltransferase
LAARIRDGAFTVSADAKTGHRVSVVLPTHRRPDGLRRVLQGLGRQADPGVPWDIVVVDNDDPPGAKEIFDTASSTLTVPCRLVHEARKGASHARNRGLEEATGSIVAFIDDDVVPADDWLACLVEPILAGRCDGTAGRVLLDPSVRIPRWIHPDLLGMLSLFDEGDTERELDPALDVLLTANAAFLTAGVRQIGGFDPALGPRPGSQMVNDDVDLFRRYAGTGRRVHYVPTPAVVHDLPRDRLTPRFMLRRAYAGGRSEWILNKREWERGRFRGVGAAVRHIAHGSRVVLTDGYWQRDAAVLASWVSRAAGIAREATRRRRS